MGGDHRPLVESKLIQKGKHPARLICHPDIQAFGRVGFAKAGEVRCNRPEPGVLERGHHPSPEQMAGGKSVQEQDGMTLARIAHVQIHVG